MNIFLERYFLLSGQEGGQLTSLPFVPGGGIRDRAASMQMQLTAHCQLREDAVVVRFKGEVDMAVADEFRSHLEAGLDAASTHPGRSLIIDLQAVAFFASAGLNAVLACHNEGASNGIAVGLVTTNPIVVRVIKATRLDEILALYPTIDDALGSFGGVKPD